MTEQKPLQWRGIVAALSTPVFLGMAPIFGKLAIQAGADPFTVAALRTLVAIGLMWAFYAVFFRRYIFIYPAGLLGCLVIGTINGIGSLFYYSGLTFLSSSLVQLINGSYLAFAIILSRIGGQKANRRTLVRVSMAMVALLIITGFNASALNWTGIGLMLGNALMFAGTVVLSQYVLYEMPAPTAALYILTTMGVVVAIVWLAMAPTLTTTTLERAALPILALATTTALSRLAMFAGVKFLGSVQTAVLGVTEIGVSLLLGAIVLGDTLTREQWLGVVILIVSILLIRQQDMSPHGVNPGALIVANMASVQFQRIAFHRAFGTQELDNAEGTMAAVTTQEIMAIQRMMGARMGGLDPFPIGTTRKLYEVDGTLRLDVDDSMEKTQPRREQPKPPSAPVSTDQSS